MSEVLQGMNIKSVKYLHSSDKDKIVVSFEKNVNGNAANGSRDRRAHRERTSLLINVSW